MQMLLPQGCTRAHGHFSESGCVGEDTIDHASVHSCRQRQRPGWGLGWRVLHLSHTHTHTHWQQRTVSGPRISSISDISFAMLEYLAVGGWTAGGFLRTTLPLTPSRTNCVRSVWKAR